MKHKISMCLITALAATFFGATAAFATPSKTYQVTGPVLDLNAKTITVQKGKEKWEIARETATEVPSDVKVGDKVTVEYYMTATEVEKKGAKPANK